MQRRNFIRLSLLTATSSLIAPILVLADNTKESRDIYYTKDAPGRWADKVATHLPNISIEKTAEKTIVKIVTAHEMKAYEHYIVKHVLLDKNYKFVAEKLFNPTTDKVASSEFELNNYSGAIYALSLCNKHDLWLNEASI